MKLALAAVIGAAILTVAIVVYAISSRDTLPEDLRGCITAAGIPLVKGTQQLQVVRRDLAIARPPQPRRQRIDGAEALTFAAPDYRLLVLRTTDNPALDRDPLAAVYRNPAPFAVVALEISPREGELSACVAELEADR